MQNIEIKNIKIPQTNIIVCIPLIQKTFIFSIIILEIVNEWGSVRLDI